MRTYVAGTVCAVLLGFASLAQGAQLLSPPYAVKTRASNGVGTKAACVVRNARTSPVTVKVSLLTSIESVGIFDFCNGHPLGGGQTCLVGTLQFAESPSHGFDVYLAVDF